MNLSKPQKQIIILYGSTLAGLLLGVVSSVLNTRSLDPVQYGDVRYVQNIISFVSSLLLVGYFTSGSRLLALSIDEKHSRKIRGAMCFILGMTWFMMGVIMFTLYCGSLASEDSNLSGLYLCSIPLGGNVLLLNYVNTTAQGDNHIGRMAIARLVPTALYIVCAGVVYNLYGASPVKMLVFHNGISIFVLLLVIVSTKPDFRELKNSLRELNEENKRYGFNVYIGSVAGVSTSYIAGIMLGQLCSDNADVGFYTLSVTLSTPLSMLPSIIGTTYFKRFATQEEISRKVLYTSFGVSIFSLIVFIIFIDLVVEFLYNANYKSVSLYASLLAVGSALHGLGDIFNRFLGSHGQGQYLRNGAMICGAVTLFGSIVFTYLWQIYGAILAKNLGSLAYLLMMISYYVKYRNKT